jgi:6-phosphogluconate dehydrogenase
MADIGLIGLGTMGANLALNFADNGYTVAVYNRTGARTQEFVAEAGALADRLEPVNDLLALVNALTPPRAVVLMVPAGAAIDAQIDALLPLLEPGDTIIDAGNANFRNTMRRAEAVEAKGLGFVGMGVSGGSEGARHGPSIMVGCTPSAWAPLEGMIKSIAAKFDGDPCAAHLGPDGAGHFVKTVHNGIEYADMQMIAEVYGLMRDGQALSPAGIGAQIAAWNDGPLKSYLIEITAEVLQATDGQTGRPMVEMILDRAGQKGTGRWTLIEALEMGQSATTIEAAVAARSWSSQHGTRAVAAGVLGGDSGQVDIAPEIYERALLAGRIISHGQGFALMQAASQEFSWGLDHARIAEICRRRRRNFPGGWITPGSPRFGGQGASSAQRCWTTSQARSGHPRLRTTCFWPPKWLKN